MNTLRQAVQDYLDPRRSLGFKLKRQAMRYQISSRLWNSIVLPTLHSVGSRMGSTAIGRSARPMGPTSELCTPVRAQKTTTT
jgi:hypothetical protein